LLLSQLLWCFWAYDLYQFPPHSLRLDEARFGRREWRCMMRAQRDKAWDQVLDIHEPGGSVYYLATLLW
jgi:hypothetical protein